MTTWTTTTRTSRPSRSRSTVAALGSIRGRRIGTRQEARSGWSEGELAAALSSCDWRHLRLGRRFDMVFDVFGKQFRSVSWRSSSSDRRLTAKLRQRPSELVPSWVHGSLRSGTRDLRSKGVEYPSPSLRYTPSG